MYDVYLGGSTSPEWRNSFKSQISSDISVFDPYVENLKSDDKPEQIAREFYFMEDSDTIVFYFDSSPSKSVRIQLGEMVGRKKQIIVCLIGAVPGKTFLQRYCEYRGVMLVESLEDLISAVEECAAELEICKMP